MKFSKINECLPGQRIKGIFICTDKQVRLTRMNSKYIQITLKDNSGIITGKMWRNIKKYESCFGKGEIVGLTAVVDVYQEMSQLRIMKIHSINACDLERYGFSYSDLSPASSKSGSYLHAQVINRARLIKSLPFRQLVINLLEKFEMELLVHPGSSRLHHNYRGGLLEHINSMLMISRQAALTYELDEDLLTTGIILHDIGKLKEIGDDLSYDYSAEGKMIGHLILSRDMIMKEAEKIKGFEKMDLLKLEHMILSHHGDYEWQSPKIPCFPEAMMLHLIDRLDAQMNLMNKTIGQDINPGEWTTSRNYFRMSLFKGLNGT